VHSVPVSSQTEGEKSLSTAEIQNPQRLPISSSQCLGTLANERKAVFAPARATLDSPGWPNTGWYFSGNTATAAAALLDSFICDSK